MLLPIELFHVCVRYVSGSTSTSRTSDGTGPRPERTEQGRAGRESFRVGVRSREAAPRVRRARAGAGACRGLALTGYWVCASRGLCVQRRSRPAGIGYLRPPYSYAIVTLTGFISPFVGPDYSYLHTSLLTLGWP